LEKPTEVSKSDSEEINQNKEKSGQKLRWRHTRKSLLNSNPVKSSAEEHQPPPDLIRKNKKLHNPKGWKAPNLHWI
jgi:hypothetical protein